MTIFDTEMYGEGLTTGPRHYHDRHGNDLYLVPPALETEFYREFPNKAAEKRHLMDRGKWLSRASEIMYDYECSKLSGSKAEPSTDILAQIFNDYISQGYLANDFILCVWDLVTKCQCNRVFEDQRSKCPMPTPKKTDLPKAAMRKALTDAMDGMNPLVTATIAAAAPEYMTTRAAEAFAAGDVKLALVLVAWHVATVSENAKAPN